MTVLPRGARPRRGGRRPGWGLLTALLVLAIAASSALVFTSRVELLKLAVIVALWAAIVAAFGSVAYRRQSDADQARARDLKLVYDLQLDREISARREYELSVESRLRHELAIELRDQAADEVAALRAELSTLRASLEMLFDADLAARPALEADRRAIRDSRVDDGADGSAARTPGGRVAAASEDAMSLTVEHPIIDVPEVRVPAGGAAEGYRGSHRRESADSGHPPSGVDRRPPREWSQPYTPPSTQPRSRTVESVESAQRQPARIEGGWLPAGAPGSDWAGDGDGDGVANPDGNVIREQSSRHAGGPDQPVSRSRHRRQAELAIGQPESTGGTSSALPGGTRRRRAATGQVAEPPHGGISVAPRSAVTGGSETSARHRSDDSGEHADAPAPGIEPIADLLARLQADSPAGRRRRRRKD